MSNNKNIAEVGSQYHVHINLVEPIKKDNLAIKNAKTRNYRKQQIVTYDFRSPKPTRKIDDPQSSRMFASNDRLVDHTYQMKAFQTMERHAIK